MKLSKILYTLLITPMIVMLLYSNAHAATLSCQLSGVSDIRAGDKIAIIFSSTGAASVSNGVFGVQGDIHYDSSVLKLTGTASKMSSPWMVEFNNSDGVINFVAYDNNLSDPIKKNTALFSMTFTVSSNAAVGSSIAVNTKGVKATDGNSDIAVPDSSIKLTVKAPLSANNFLSSLTAENISITPAFNKNTLTYHASVPFEVTSIKVTGTAEDAKAKVSSANTSSLKAGTTTNIPITVTAENGAKRVYFLKVKREKDPNAPSSQAAGTTSSKISSEPYSSIAESESSLKSSAASDVTDNGNNKIYLSNFILLRQIVFSIILLAIGFAGGFFVKDRITRKG